MRQYVQSHAQDELLKIYRREYKRRFAWIRAGKISQEAPELLPEIEILREVTGDPAYKNSSLAREQKL